ncbi:MAG: Hsp20/alpha crystallin family protein [Nitrosopumilales archaeon]|jgi:HSP20 family protein|nr:MAG: Hsp20/alpha crystallin family protein [Nitrosopumilales archaeon]
MTSGKSEITRRKALFPTAFDDIFEGFRKDMEDVLFFPRWNFLDRRNELVSDLETRLPLCDMEDLGDKYEVTLEAPGIPKDKITVKAGTNYIDLSGENEKKTEEKRKNYVYNERSYSSLRRRISTPEEIDPSKIDAKMENGVLHIQVPKKTPTQNKETKVEVK